MIRLHSALNRSLTVMVVVSLLLGSMAPLANAQDNAPDASNSHLYLPLISSRQPVAENDLLFRTRVTINTTAQWHDLERLQVVVLSKGEDWAQLLVDDDQLETLARWRYSPQVTDSLASLLNANANLDGSLVALMNSGSVAHLQNLLAAAQASTEISPAAQSELDSARAAVRTAIQALPSTALASLATSVTPDADGDGLSDTQEGYWCTASNNPDSDGDGSSDGAEVNALKEWMNNKRSVPPSTAQPFNGWTAEIPGCLDNDRDSIPNLAERYELGLNMNKESTDRDKFDDGQEVFGVTYCPGSGTACGYGSQPPASHDGIVLFPEMPSWVKAPGNHPLVAAFPVPEIDVVESSLHVETVTEVTTDHVISSGTERSYSTAKTEGTSKSETDTTSWNEWEENSVTTALNQLSAAQTETPDGPLPPGFAQQNCPGLGPVYYLDKICYAGTSIINFGYDLCEDENHNLSPQQCKRGAQKKIQTVRDAANSVENTVQSGWNGLKNWGAKIVDNIKYINNQAINLAGKSADWVQDNIKVNSCSVGFPWGVSCELGLQQSTQDGSGGNLNRQKYSGAYSDIVNGAQSHQIQESNNAGFMASYFPIEYPVPQFVPTSTETHGRSWGGSHSTTNTQYEEQTITNGEAFSSEESWGNATAVNSAHAADLWFTYKVRNTGTEYAKEIKHLAFNIYIGDDPNPACTYFFGTNQCGVAANNNDVQFANLMPNEEKTFTSGRIPLSLNQMKTLEADPQCAEWRAQGIIPPYNSNDSSTHCPGSQIRIVVEEFTYGDDEIFYQDAANAGVVIAIEDGAADGDESIDTYLIPTWDAGETVLTVLSRYFPHQTDSNGTLISIWTPEYRSDNPSWCQSPRRPTDYPNRVVWCKHALSTADWWNVYTDGLGNGSEGFQTTPAVPGATALFRFNQDSDLDGFSDRSERQMGTDPYDATSFPKPELLAGLHNIRNGNKVTSTLSLLNTGIYDAYGVEAVMIAPNDTISITNNTVGGSGRVRAQKQVIVGSRIQLQALTSTPWVQANHAQPAVGGYYTGSEDRTYTFTVNCALSGGCNVGSDSWSLFWIDSKGISGTLPFGSGYKSPAFQSVGNLGVTLALYTGKVNPGETFAVAATTPRDTFQYTINREPYTPPLVIVSYNDPQGNHRFMLPTAAMSLTAPTDNLQVLAGSMLQNAGVEIVTTQPFTLGVNNSVQLLVNNPSDKTLSNAHLFLEFINIGSSTGDIHLDAPANVSSTVVAEIPTQVTLPPGPTYTPVNFNSGLFDPPYNAAGDYIVMAFLTDYQGNILDTAGRPLSSFQVDPLPALAVANGALTWIFGTATHGTLLKRTVVLANTGYGRLDTYLSPTQGLTLNRTSNQSIGAADTPTYELTLHTEQLPVGAYDQTVLLSTSDPRQPSLPLHVSGMIVAPAPDASIGVMQRPLDVVVTVTGTHMAGEWITFTHALGPIGSMIHPVKIYSSDYAKLWGTGKTATDFDNSITNKERFGTGADGDITISSDVSFNTPSTSLGTTSASVGQISLSLSNTSGFAVNDEVLIYQVTGSGAGNYEFDRLASKSGNQVTLSRPLQNNYTNSNPSLTQIVRVPNYRNVIVTSAGYWHPTVWNGGTGGILIFRASGSVVIQSGGRVEATGAGFRGGTPTCRGCSGGNQGESYLGLGGVSIWANGSGGGGGQSDPSPNGGNGSASGGGGGGYANVGSNGSNGPSTNSGQGGSTVGDAVLSKIYFGGAGGAGGTGDEVGASGGIGGSGGGIIWVSGRVLTIDGTFLSNGMNGGADWFSAGGGAGAGGSIYLGSDRLSLNGSAIGAVGGNGFSGRDATGGNGSVGRIRTEYCDSMIGGTNPAPSTQKLTCYITEQNSNTTTRFNLPEAVSGSKTYNVQFGHKLDFSAAGELTSTLRVPAGLVANSTLDLLISNAGAGNLSLKLDIGNDGSWDWEATQNVTSAATFSSPDLSTAFNQYWSGHGSPTSGNIDIPVRLSLSKAATALLTNLQQLNLTATATPTVAAGAKPLDVSVAITGSHTAGEWVQFTHNLGPNPQSLQPVKVYSDTSTTLWGVGRYATNFGQGTASADMFGDGRDGVMPGSGNLDYANGAAAGIVNNGSAGSASLSVTDVYNIARVNPGDVVMLHQTQGSGAGCWEVNKAVSDFGGGTATYQLASPLKCNYSTSGNNHAQILRVPQYSTCNVTGTVTPLTTWNGSWGGILAVMCNGNMLVSGSVTSLGFGFRGGTGGVKGSTDGQVGNQGESSSNSGGRTWLANNSAGGGGEGDQWPNAGAVGKGGGGGTYQGSGGNGGHDRNNPVRAQDGSGIGGDLDLVNAFMGSGGGGGGADAGDSAQAIAPSGGSGGGFIFIAAKQAQLTGQISSSGQNGGNSGSWTGGGGGGSGGAIWVTTALLQTGTGLIQSVAGVKGYSVNDPNNSEMFGGNGTNGRIHLGYCESITGTTNPPASTQKLTCHVVEQVESSPYTTARLNLPETFSGGRTYTVQFGRMITYTASGSQVTSLRVPAGLYSNVQLDALVSGLPTTATLSLDVSNDGSVDWSKSAGNNSANTSLSLADAFTAYWRTQNSPLTGTLDVPIRVALNQPGQVLLSNLWVQTTANKVRYIRLPVQNYNQVKLDFTIGGSGSANLTVAADVGDNGSVDWSESVLSTTLPYRFVQRDLTAAINSYLNGKSGEVDVPIRFYVSPDQSVTLNDFTSKVTRLTDLSASQLNPGLQVQASATPTLTVSEGNHVNLQALISNNGNQASGPVSAAFFATAQGWGDWYIGSRFIPNLEPTASTQVEVDWDTTGFSGTTPVKVVVNPYRRVTESNYANNTMTMTVVVEPPPLPPVADFTATPISGTAPLTVQFTDTTTSTVAISSRLWNFGDGSTSNAQNPVHVYANAGSYTVTLTASASNGSDTKVRGNYILVSQPIPPPVVDFSASPTSGTAPLLVQFSDHSSGAISSWQWNFGDGSLSTTQNPTHTYSAGGSYTVTLTVSGAGGSQSKTTPSLINVTAVPTPITVTLTLLPGWNLVSIPIQPSNPAVASLLSPINGHYDLVYAYRQCDTADPWKKYDTQSPPILNDLVTVDPSMGLWVRMNTTDTLPIAGTLPVSSTIALCSGWNLVGYPALTTSPLPDALAAIQGCYSYVYTYDTANQSWPKYDVARPFFSTLLGLSSQRGYWIKAEQACTWVVNNN